MTERRNHIVSSFVKFLKDELAGGTLSADSAESIEVAIQCLESACNLDSGTVPVLPLADMFTKYELENAQSQELRKIEAEQLKNDGNNLMKADKYMEALENYTKAILLDDSNAVFYCNRAAAYSKLNNHDAAIRDCKTALQIDPTYSKAYGRLGLAYSIQNKHAEALVNYKKALELEPENESYRNNLTLTEEKLQNPGTGSSQAAPSIPVIPGIPGFDLGMLQNNSTLISMATQMLTDPAMQNLMSGLITGNQGAPDMEALIEAGQQFAQQMQSTNPDLVETLRRQMGSGEQNDNDNANP